MIVALAEIAALYVVCGAAIAAVAATPGALIDPATGRGAKVSPAGWVMIVALWPVFSACWFLNLVRK